MHGFSTTGDIVKVIKFNEDGLVTKLAPKVYTVCKEPLSGTYYLEISKDKFSEPTLYGNTEERADKIIKAFNARELPTGVLLSGIKG